MRAVVIPTATLGLADAPNRSDVAVPSDPTALKRTVCARLADPHPVQHDDKALCLDDPVLEEPTTVFVGCCPVIAVVGLDVQHGAGRRRVDPQDGRDPGEVTLEDGWCLAELLTDAVGEDQPVPAQRRLVLSCG
jgi:hypothetical protein